MCLVIYMYIPIDTGSINLDNEGFFVKESWNLLVKQQNDDKEEWLVLETWLSVWGNFVLNWGPRIHMVATYT